MKNAHKIIAGGAILFIAFLLPLAAEYWGLHHVTPLVPDGTTEADRNRVRGSLEAFGGTPLVFEENLGQADERVRYLSRGKGWMVFFTPFEAVVVLTSSGRSVKGGDTTSRDGIHRGEGGKSWAAHAMSFPGASSHPRINGVERLPGMSNYYRGNDPRRWLKGVPNFGRVRYENLYPGIDLEFFGRGSILEYDFVVAPGADPEMIKVEFNGPVRAELTSGGGLRVVSGSGEILHHPPLIYQETGGARRVVPGRFVGKGEGSFGFEVASFDRSRTLVIDPEISYSTYLGGNSLDEGLSLAVDGGGNAIVTGRTQSEDFPLNLARQGDLQGTTDLFVTKLSPSGSNLIYSTYLGGLGEDEARGVAVDVQGNAYVAGRTDSDDFPVEGGFQGNLQGPADAFFAKLGPLGGLLHSTYLGGSDADEAFGVAVSPGGNVFLTGRTSSEDFPIPLAANSFQRDFGGGPADAFLLRIVIDSFNVSSLTYSSYLGGAGEDEGRGITLDLVAIPNVYVTGSTVSEDFPVKGAQGTLQGEIGGSEDAFVAKFDRTFLGPASLVYSTYLGGIGVDRGAAVGVDGSGNAYVTGETGSTDLPLRDPFQPTLGGGLDVFVSKLNVAGSTLLYSTYLGGAGNDRGTAIDVTGAGTAFVTGSTGSSDFPIEDPVQESNNGFNDLFVTKLKSDGSSLLYSTYLGGSGSDRGEGIAFMGTDEAYVAGVTDSDDFPADAFEEVYQGNGDAFVLKVRERKGVQRFDVVRGCGVNGTQFKATDFSGTCILLGIIAIGILFREVLRGSK